jgi:hypothetical protein
VGLLKSVAQQAEWPQAQQLRPSEAAADLAPYELRSGAGLSICAPESGRGGTRYHCGPFGRSIGSLTSDRLIGDELSAHLSKSLAGAP